MKIFKKTKEKGFTLLFAVLLSVLVLSVGASVINIAMKQVILSGVGRESQFAFYAANTGIECALYWDLNEAGVFATSSFSVDLEEDVAANIKCGESVWYNGDNFNINRISESKAETTFKIKFPDPLQYCAIVKVTKEKDANNDGAIRTTIESRGYNTCETSNPRRIERGLQLSY